MFEPANRINVVIGAGNVNTDLVQVAASASISVVGVTSSPVDLVEMAATQHPDAVVMHAASAGPATAHVIAMLRRRVPLTRIVVFLDAPTDQSLRQVLGYGAHAALDVAEIQASAVPAIRSVIAELRGSGRVLTASGAASA